MTRTLRTFRRRGGVTVAELCENRASCERSSSSVVSVGLPGPATAIIGNPERGI